MNKNTILWACIAGLFAGIAFILIQPLFGMATLTSRHADAYINFGGYTELAALFLSWFVHISVSIFYALLSTLIFKYNHSILMSIGQIIGLGWLTTLTATPANEWVVKLVNTETFPALSSLSALNTDIGPKLWLHFLFFGFVVATLYLLKMKKPRP